jgi:hypothetical protein
VQPLASECSGSSLRADIDNCYILLDWAYHLPAATPLAYQLLSGAVAGSCLPAVMPNQCLASRAYCRFLVAGGNAKSVN